MPLRLLLVLIVALMAACNQPAQPTPPPGAGPATDTLRAAAAPLGKRIGVAVQSGLMGDPRYRAVVARDFSDVTPEFEMKWAVIEPTRGVRNFSASDALLADAAALGVTARGHTLVWHRSVPPWAESLDPADFRIAFEDHIRAVARHYAGRVRAWDVVNEAMADSGQGRRDSVFRQKLGDDYIADAFRLAHEADPQAQLFYNDYGGEGMTAKSHRIYELVTSLLSQGVPIDGVGLQMHINALNFSSGASVGANIGRLSALGLRVHITEMDVRIDTVPGTLTARLNVQRSAYHEIISACVREPACEAITFWGLTDAYSWIGNGGNDGPLLFDANYLPKHAYYGVLDALRGR